MNPLWQPDTHRIAASRLTEFQQGVETATGQTFANYDALHTWSVTETGAFWEQVWQYCSIKASQPYQEVVTNLDQFPGATWFPGSRLNFAENLLLPERKQDDRAALIGILENGHRTQLTYAELFAAVEKLASALRNQGVTVGDRVAALMPNICETVIAMLATTSIGAIWSSCSPDFGVNGACDRFGQIQPKVLFAAESYCYNGKTIDCLDKIDAIQQRIDSIETTIVIPMLRPDCDISALANSHWYASFIDQAPPSLLVFEQLPFNHPVYINYSSGTTGVPKCIVHGAGGTLIQHQKELALHVDLGPDDTLFYFTTCGWMMWNWLVSGLGRGCTVVLYDGSPFAQDGDILLDAIDREQISVFGTGAKFIDALAKTGKQPRLTHRLDSLKTILSTGSPLNKNSYEYIYRDFKQDVCLASICGGTDLISCFLLSHPNLPVYSGEIQCRGLGMAVEFWDDQGQPVTGEKGELVCVKAFPSTPIGFWNDPGDEKFHKAYFNRWPNVWAHGDYGEITANDGIVIHGRSDAVLNPGGVRIGTAEIYRQVETIPEVMDSVVIGQDWQDDVRVVLFVVLRAGVTLDDTLRETIKTTIRANTTPRHVPAVILDVADIPRTRSGKIAELAVRHVVHNQPIKNTEALANPEALDLFKSRSELKA